MSVRLRFVVPPLLLALIIVSGACVGLAQPAEPLKGKAVYDALKGFQLKGKAEVANLVFKRDRAEMSFTGDFYFAAPVNGRITGAVFIGNGTFKAAAPPLPFEKENMVRMINADVAESDFKTAVLRFSDDSFDVIGKGWQSDAAAPADAQSLAAEFEPRMLKETGANLSARLMTSLINKESPGFFVAQFDKGTRDRFTLLVDPQCRIPSSAFGINGGEKVLLFHYAPYAYTNDVWIATYSDEDLAKGRTSYSDQYDLVAPLNYSMSIDLREPRRILRTTMRVDFESLTENLNSIPMDVNDGLTEFDNYRIKHMMRVTSAKYEGQDLPFIQEEWESGITLILPKTMQKNQKFSVELALEGDFIDDQRVIENGYYPLSNESWYPRHGYLKRSTFSLTFRHRKKVQVASAGKLIRETEWPDDKNDRLTEFRMEHPVALASFAAGSIERNTERRKLSFGEMELEFYSLPGAIAAVKEDFILAEMGNALDYFSSYFGPYPYGSFRGAFHPFNFGQGFPTVLFIPKADKAERNVYSFISHETSHQWWGGVVAWRSYRDQWLSEGFAEYSGILYTQMRDNKKQARELIEDIRYELPFPPKEDTGVGKGKLAEMGPLILGRRLATRKSMNAYQTLIYGKGALVLRMLHFLFTDPTTGNGQPFFDMMSDFVKRYRGKAATTEEFIQVASEHFARTQVARQLRLGDLNWFFRQWVYEAKLPSYRMEYTIEQGADGKPVLSGTVFQDNAPENWFMPLPLVLGFDKQKATALLYANGPKTPFKMALPMKPSSVEMDPDWWILSEKTSTKKQ